MGLKTNKATKTSRLNCQYVGSFSVKNGDRKFATISEENKYVDEKLKNCKKKILDGMPVCLQVSPDGIEVLASDEKTIKMAHTLRRVSYATVEPTNKLFAYVSHQPGADMEVVCHTFATKKKDHAEGLSAVLGKLFKQTFAYTLKRRDKLEEAAQKRGAGRRWAKQQVGEGHIAVTKNGRNARTRSVDVAQLPARKENDVPSRTAVQQKAGKNTAIPTNENIEPRKQRRSPPGIPYRSNSPELEDSPFSSTAATVHQPPSPSRQAKPASSPTMPQEWETPFVAPSRPPKPNSSLRTSSTEDENQAPALPSRPRPNGSSSHSFSPWSSQEADLPPELPSRNPGRQSSTPSSPESDITPVLPKVERKFSAPELIAASLTHAPARTSLSSDLSIESPVSRDLQDAAAVLLAAVDNTPPPLPRKSIKRPANLPPLETSTIPEEVIEPEEDEELRQKMRDEPRISLTLEDEDWYIPAVSREMVTEMLEMSDIGTFLVRDSQSRPGCYALTMKVIKGENNPTGCGNYLIVPEGDGFALQSFDKVFPDISSLIRHYASNDDGLPCRLVLAGSNPLFNDANGYLVEFMDEEDEKYASLSSCTSMCQELDMNNPW